MYLDPSFGGMLLQILIAVAAAGGVIVFGMRRKIKALFKKDKENAGVKLIAKNTGDAEDDVIDMLSDEK